MVIKENLFNIIKTKDGLYSILFIKNVTNILIREIKIEKYQNDLENYLNKSDCLSTIW